MGTVLYLSCIRQSRETVSLPRFSYLKAATFRPPLSEGFSCRRRREDDRWTVELSGAPVFTSGAPVFTSGAPVFTSGAPVFTSGSTGSCFRLLLLLLLTGSALLRLGTGWSKLYKRKEIKWCYFQSKSRRWNIKICIGRTVIWTINWEQPVEC